jgi:hypothetical protein
MATNDDERDGENEPEPKSEHERVQQWLAHRYGSGALAPLTGQDSRAFTAAVYTIALWGGSDKDGKAHAVKALRSLVMAMQPHTRSTVRAAIPAVLDWGYEAELWPLVMPRDDGRTRLVPLPGRLPR